MTIRPAANVIDQYRALGEACGYHHLSARTLLELRGSDRAKFLHNFCTADIKRLQPRQGSEVFITNVQGKTIGYLDAFVLQERIVLSGAAGQAAALLPHLGKYILLDDAELHDHSDAWSAAVAAGSEAKSILAEALSVDVPRQPCDHVESTVEATTLLLARVGLAGPDSFLLIGERAAVAAACQKLDAAGAMGCTREALEMRRVEAGWPEFGSEVTDANLPQEVSRDKEAISFTKGCYLGQETVARIDALGHVNRYLRVVRFGGDALPERGWEHAIDGKRTVQVTSSAYSPALDCPLTLAYIRRGHEAIGTTFDTELGPAEVVAPPGAC